MSNNPSDFRNFTEKSVENIVNHANKSKKFLEK